MEVIEYGSECAELQKQMLTCRLKKKRRTRRKAGSLREDGSPSACRVEIMHVLFLLLGFPHLSTLLFLLFLDIRNYVLGSPKAAG